MRTWFTSEKARGVRKSSLLGRNGFGARGFFQAMKRNEIGGHLISLFARFDCCRKKGRSLLVDDIAVFPGCGKVSVQESIL